MKPKRMALIGRWWLLVTVSTILAASTAYVVSARQDANWEARAVLVVPAGFGEVEDLLGRPSEAARLASTYAVLLGQDNQLLSAVANTTGRDFADIRRNLVVENLATTSTIEITANGRSEDEASELLGALVSAATGETPASALIAPGSLARVRVGAPVEEFTPPTLLATLVGAVLGAALAIVVAGVLERSHPHIDAVTDAVEGIPLTPSSDISGDYVAALAERWNELADGAGPIVLIQAKRTGKSAAERLAATTPDLIKSLGMADPPRDVMVATAAQPGALTSAGLVVLVIRRGASLEAVMGEINKMCAINRPVRWTVLNT